MEPPTKELMHRLGQAPAALRHQPAGKGRDAIFAAAMSAALRHSKGTALG